jgi:DNA gyrase subunit B
VKRGKKTSKSVSGTTIHFWPDPEIFPKIAFDLDHILVRMREIAFLNPGLTIVVTEESSGQNETLSFKGGLIEYVNFLNDGKDLLFPRKPVLFEGKVGEIEIAIAFQFSDQNDATEMSFANTINTVEGGNHLSGFRAGMTREINSWAKDCGALKEKDGNLDGKDVREGITAIISVRLTRPQFEGQTKTKLGNPEVEAAVSQFTQDAMHGFLQANAAVGKAIVERALTSKRARAAAKAAAEGIRRKGAFGGHRMPDKLRDCRSTNAEECEMFIVEGRSASGPALEARDSRTQAVFAIRGVILNVEKSRLDQALGNAEVQGIITAVGAGFSGADENGVDLSGLRYGKIIILTDADPDGGHIQTLLMTLFFRFMRPVIEGGHLYIAQPPLFKLEAGKKKFFALDEAELADLQKKHGSGRVTRFKGLGEQSAAELGETAIRPETRRIFRVAIDNVGEADREFVSLMGKDAEPRKVFLLKHGGERFEGAFR